MSLSSPHEMSIFSFCSQRNMALWIWSPLEHKFRISGRHLMFSIGSYSTNLGGTDGGRCGRRHQSRGGGMNSLYVETKKTCIRWHRKGRETLSWDWIIRRLGCGYNDAERPPFSPRPWIPKPGLRPTLAPVLFFGKESIKERIIQQWYFCLSIDNGRENSHSKSGLFS